MHKITVAEIFYHFAQSYHSVVTLCKNLPPSLKFMSGRGRREPWQFHLYCSEDIQTSFGIHIQLKCFSVRNTLCKLRRCDSSVFHVLSRCVPWSERRRPVRPGGRRCRLRWPWGPAPCRSGLWAGRGRSVVVAAAGERCSNAAHSLVWASGGTCHQRTASFFVPPVARHWFLRCTLIQCILSGRLFVHPLAYSDNI